MLGDNCSSACPTKDHESWGACIRDKGLRISWAASAKNLDRTSEKKWEQNLNEYSSLVKQGIEPENTWPSGVLAAKKKADKGI